MEERQLGDTTYPSFQSTIHGSIDRGNVSAIDSAVKEDVGDAVAATPARNEEQQKYKQRVKVVLRGISALLGAWADLGNLRAPGTSRFRGYDK